MVLESGPNALADRYARYAARPLTSPLGGDDITGILPLAQFGGEVHGFLLASSVSPTLHWANIVPAGSFARLWMPLYWSER